MAKNDLPKISLVANLEPVFWPHRSKDSPKNWCEYSSKVKLVHVKRIFLYMLWVFFYNFRNLMNFQKLKKSENSHFHVKLKSVIQKLIGISKFCLYMH